ncbi:MAG: hypothetical protein JO316_16900 [Abitibacteriaceae bacterium]|nr:hypothetical protein [Abditibacteriaceae bacterium]MBV9867034.1 hypothetical protein [Abditibacteriaceae bacterium]
MKSQQRRATNALVVLSVIAGLCATNGHAQGPKGAAKGPAGADHNRRPPGPGGRGFGERGFGGPGFGGPGGFRLNAKMRLSRYLHDVGELETGKNQLSKSQAKQVVLLVQPWQKKPTMSEADAQALLTKLSAVLNTGQKSALTKLAAQDRPPGGRMGGPGGGPGGGFGRGFGGPGGPPPDGPPPGGGRRGDGRRGGPPNGQRPDGPPPGGFDGRMGGPGMGGPGRGPGGGPPSAKQMQQMRQRMQQMQGFFKTFNPLYPPASSPALKAMPAPMREGAQRRYQNTAAIISRLSHKAQSK